MISFAYRAAHSLIRSEALKQSALLSVGNAVTGVIMAVAMIIASRSLGPEKFGVFSVSIAVMSVLSKGVDLGLNQLIPRLMNMWHDEPDNIKAFLGQIMVWKLWLVGGMVVLSAGLVVVLVDLLNYPYPGMLAWAVFGGLVIGLYEHVILTLSAFHKFTWVTILNVGQALLKLFGFVAVLLMFPAEVQGIAAVYYAAPFVAALGIGWLFHDLIWARPATAPASVRQPMLRFVFHAGVGVVAMTLIMNLDVLLVQRYLNAFETGLYAGATRIAVFVGFFTHSVGGVLNNRVSRYSTRKVLVQYLQKSLLLSLVAIAGFIAFLPFARLAVLWTIGPEYIDGVGALVVLVLNAFLSLAVVPYVSFFYAVDHPNYFSYGGILQVLIIGLGSWLFLPSYGITAAAWSKVIATLAFSVYTAWYVWYAVRQLKE